MSNTISHYETLDILTTANADEIQAAYRSKVDFHLNTSDPSADLLEQIRVAFSVLSNGELRKAYDRKLERDCAASDANALGSTAATKLTAAESAIQEVVMSSLASDDAGVVTTGVDSAGCR